jgi:DNA-binding GntR family transcriptional regulator
MDASAQKPAPATAVDKAVAGIRAKIKDGIYVPGQRLIEADLTRALGVSRGPLREAMWRLAGEGLVKIEPNRGVVVRKLTRREVRDIYDIREMLEGLAARLAAEYIDEPPNRSLLRAARTSAANAAKQGDPYAYLPANEALHDAIVRISGNTELATLLSQLRLPVFRLQFRRLLTSAGMVQSNAEHEEVTAAILKGDPQAAERAMRKHVRNSGRMLQELPDAAFD